MYTHAVLKLYFFVVVQNALGVKEEFLLFASFFEVTMMEPAIGSKPVKFEISIGKFDIDLCSL